MNERLADSGGDDWTRGPARTFGACVILILVGTGAWILGSRERRESPWSEAGTPFSMATLDPADSVAGAEARRGALSDGTLDLNLATSAQLELLPGIGPSGAARIVEYRNQIGGYRSIDELLGVKGIGEKTLAKLRPLLRVEPTRSPSDR